MGGQLEHNSVQGRRTSAYVGGEHVHAYLVHLRREAMNPVGSSDRVNEDGRSDPTSQHIMEMQQLQGGSSRNSQKSVSTLDAAARILQREPKCTSSFTQILVAQLLTHFWVKRTRADLTSLKLSRVSLPIAAHSQSAHSASPAAAAAQLCSVLTTSANGEVMRMRHTRRNLLSATIR
jgi:hypothetical protein